MKKLITILLSLSLVNAFASDVNISHTFNAGSPAVAAEVNQNFQDIKTSVDDNHARLSDVETQTQPLATGCSAGSAIRAIDINGNVICEVDDDTNSGGDITAVSAGTGLSGGGTSGNVSLSLDSGFISVDHISLIPAISEGCEYVKNSTYFYWSPSSTNGNCNGVAHVHLPHQSTLTQFRCFIYNNTSNSVTVRLTRYNLDNNTTEVIFDFVNYGGSTSRRQYIMYGANPGTGTVDNGNYSYYVSWLTSNYDTTSVSNNGRFYACSIAYTY